MRETRAAFVPRPTGGGTGDRRSPGSGLWHDDEGPTQPGAPGIQTTRVAARVDRPDPDRLRGLFLPLAGEGLWRLQGRRVRVAFLASVVLAATLLAVPAQAVQPDEILPDPALEQRARELSAELRCMVCQNQSIDDSNAPLARDLRLLVRERLVAGDSNEQVLSFLVDRYGEFVLLKPSFSGHTLLLWLAAPAVLIAGGLIAWGVVGRNRRRPEAAPLSAEEEAELARLRGGAAGAPETPSR